MSRLLMISYRYPPVVNPGAIRAGKFSKYLPQYEWSPVILTTKPLPHEMLDPMMFKEVYRKIVITRIASKELKFRGFDRIKRYFPMAAAELSWYPGALKNGLQLIKDNQCAAIWSTALPPVCHLVGAALKKRTGLPLILDYRDLWSFNPYWRYPTSIHRRLDRVIEQRVLSLADAVITVTQEMSMQLKLLSSGVPIHSVITNGYDQEDFGNTNRIPQSNVIAHIGSLYGKRVQTAICIIAALEAYEKKKVLLRQGDLKIQLIGVIDHRIKSHALMKLKKISLEIDGQISHTAAIKAMQEAGILLLISDAAESGSLTSKIFEYLASMRPILVVGHAKEITSIIEDLEDCRYVPDATDQKAILVALEECLILANDPNGVNQGKRKQILNQYSRKNLTGDLSQVLDKIS